MSAFYVYLDVNVIINFLKGEKDALATKETTERRAILNLARKQAGDSKFCVCSSAHQFRVLNRKCRELGLMPEFARYREFLIHMVKATGGVIDEVLESFEDLNIESRRIGFAPLGEDLGHLKAMRRMDVDLFITDDHVFAEQMLIDHDPIQVMKETTYLRLASRQQLTRSAVASNLARL